MQVNDEQLFRIDLTKLWKRSLDTKEIRGIYCNIYFSIFPFPRILRIIIIHTWQIKRALKPDCSTVNNGRLKTRERQTCHDISCHFLPIVSVQFFTAIFLHTQKNNIHKVSNARKRSALQPTRGRQLPAETRCTEGGNRGGRFLRLVFTGNSW